MSDLIASFANVARKEVSNRSFFWRSTNRGDSQGNASRRSRNTNRIADVCAPSCVNTEERHTHSERDEEQTERRLRASRKERGGSSRESRRANAPRRYSSARRATGGALSRTSILPERFSRSTTALMRCASCRGNTATASAVSITTKSSRPIAATRRLVDRT